MDRKCGCFSTGYPPPTPPFVPLRRCKAAMRNPAARARSAARRAGRGAPRQPIASRRHWAVCDLTLQDTAKRTKFLPSKVRNLPFSFRIDVSLAKIFEFWV